MCNKCFRTPCCCVYPCSSIRCNITIKDYTPCPPKCYQVWIPQKYNFFTKCFVPGHYEYICADDANVESVTNTDTHSHSNVHNQNQLVGGCAGTRYGCCTDGTTAKVDQQGSNCPQRPIIGGCAGTRYGCCKDGVTSKVDEAGSNCPQYNPCGTTCYNSCCKCRNR